MGHPSPPSTIHVALFDLASVAVEEGIQNVPAESSINAIKPNMFHLQWPMADGSAYPDHIAKSPHFLLASFFHLAHVLKGYQKKELKLEIVLYVFYIHDCKILANSSTVNINNHK